jgi:tRNA wybutosine-synthesizing protein 2
MKLRELLARSLGGKLTKEELSHLPRSYQRIGHIAILSLHPSLRKHAKDVGNAILNTIPGVRTVCSRGPVKGVLREPSIEVIAGEENTLTTYRENKCIFEIDVARLMLAKGNVYERGRVARLVRDGEVVVDLFAGIGYFSIPIAVNANPSKVYAIDVNPLAIKFLRQNIELNGVGGKVVPVLGDCREVVRGLGKVADRVIMGYLIKTHEFLPAAFKTLKREGGIIHYHEVFGRDELFDKPIAILSSYALRCGYELKRVLHKRIVKSYSPGKLHAVVDAEFIALPNPKMDARSSKSLLSRSSYLENSYTTRVGLL